MSRADDKIKNIHEDAKEAMKRLSNKNYRYASPEAVNDDLRTVQKLLDRIERDIEDNIEQIVSSKLNKMFPLLLDSIENKLLVELARKVMGVEREEPQERQKL